MPDSVVLASGGINSTVVAARARQSGEVCLLFADYGQPSAAGQRAAVRAISEAIGAGFAAIEMPQVAKIAMIKRGAGGRIAHEAYAAASIGAVGQTPALAVGLLSAGVQLAYRVGASRVLVGASELANELETESAPGAGSPDHRREYFYLAGLMVEQLQRSRTPITFEAPVIDLSRAEIIKLGHRDGVPFDLTFSCRASRDVACGQCAACLARVKAFAAANLIDPALSAVRG